MLQTIIVSIVSAVSEFNLDLDYDSCKAEAGAVVHNESCFVMRKDIFRPGRDAHPFCENLGYLATVPDRETFEKLYEYVVVSLVYFRLLFIFGPLRAKILREGVLRV